MIKTVASRGILALAFSFGLAVTTSACGTVEPLSDEYDCAIGSENCACYGNGSCASGLVCRSNLCVEGDDQSGGGNDSGGSAGAPATGGTGGAVDTGGTGGTVDTGGTGGTGGSVDTGGTGGTGGTVDTGGTGGSGGTVDTSIPPTLAQVAALGASCASNADCDGLHCVTKDGGEIDGDGVPNGVCTAACGGDGNTFCDGLSGSCIQFDEAGAVVWCVETCQPFTAVPPANETMDPNFCHGRLEHSCRPLASGAACLPTCNNDTDCGTFFCDVGSGFCVPARPTGDPIGTACDTRIVDENVPDAQKPADTCAGRCIGQVDVNGILVGATCSGNCTSGTLGEVVNCGSDPTGAVPPHAACLWVFDTNAGAGDFGACGQLCECGTDCLDPGAGCEDFATGTPYSEADYRRVFGQAGYCRANPDNPRTTCR